VSAFDPYKIMELLEGNKLLQSKDPSQKVQYSGHVLVAEDNRANQMLLKLLLEEYGLSYVITSNGEEAFSTFKDEKFDIILMDEQMPIMGGLEACEKIIQYEFDNNLNHTPIISVTANALKGDKERFLEAGMDGYISKPIENDKLEKVLNQFIPHEGENMGQNLELPSYNNLSAEEMASKIGLNVKHIPILVQSFTDESAGIMQQLEEAISAMDYDAIANAAHSIKGSSGNLKFVELYELAKDVELSAKDKKADFPYAEASASIKNAIESISL
jgi:CheY-like chemotaxis protein